MGGVGIICQNGQRTNQLAFSPPVVPASGVLLIGRLFKTFDCCPPKRFRVPARMPIGQAPSGGAS